jgi:chloramphenicol-sensitive protein RarD
MRDDHKGLLYAGSAFLFWGLSPLFWKLLTAVPPGRVVAHRVVWSTLFLALLLLAGRRWGEVRRVLRSRTAVLMLGATTLLIGANWLIFIWAVAAGRVLDASLGYFVTPLVSVFLGVVFLREALSHSRVVALTLAAVGVGILALRFGQVPWVALALALSFGLYGLLRKVVQADAEVGLLIETALLAPFCLAYLLLASGGEALPRGATGWLLVACGPVTTLPLLWFTHGARRLPLSTVGFLQYLSPSLQFLLAVALFREPFTLWHLGAFVFIWAGLAVFTAGTRRPAAPLEAVPAAPETAAGEPS